CLSTRLDGAVRPSGQVEPPLVNETVLSLHRHIYPPERCGGKPAVTGRYDVLVQTVGNRHGQAHGRVRVDGRAYRLTVAQSWRGHQCDAPRGAASVGRTVHH